MTNTIGVSTDELAILRHMLTGTNEPGGRVYRNYFSAGLDHADAGTLTSLAEKGLVRCRRNPFSATNDLLWHATDAGKAVVDRERGVA